MRRTRCAFRLASAMLLDCTWSFLHDHFNDLFLIPAALLLWLHRQLGLRLVAGSPGGGGIQAHPSLLL